MSKKGRKDDIVIQKSTVESILMVLFIVVLTFIGIKLMYEGAKNISNIESNEEVIAGLEQGSFNDSELNVVMSYPSKWVLTQIDNEIMEIKRDVVSKSANDGKFDIMVDKLVEETISMLVVNNPTQQVDGTQSHSQFISVSFMGDIESMEKQEKLEVLTERFKKSIDISNPDDTKVIEVVKSIITPYGDIYIELNVKFETGTIKYGQYSKTIGKNIATAIIGSSIEDEGIYDKVDGVVNSIKTR